MDEVSAWFVGCFMGLIAGAVCAVCILSFDEVQTVKAGRIEINDKLYKLTEIKP